MKQLYFPLTIEASEFRAVLHSSVYNTDLVAVEGLTAKQAVDQAESTIPDLNKSFDDDL